MRFYPRIQDIGSTRILFNWDPVQRVVACETAQHRTWSIMLLLNASQLCAAQTHRARWRLCSVGAPRRIFFLWNSPVLLQVGINTISTEAHREEFHSMTASCVNPASSCLDLVPCSSCTGEDGKPCIHLQNTHYCIGFYKILHNYPFPGWWVLVFIAIPCTSNHHHLDLSQIYSVAFQNGDAGASHAREVGCSCFLYRPLRVNPSIFPFIILSTTDVSMKPFFFCAAFLLCNLKAHAAS